jgi:hypothetical protein
MIRNSLKVASIICIHYSQEGSIFEDGEVGDFEGCIVFFLLDRENTFANRIEG